MRAVTALRWSSESSAAAGLCWRLGSLIPVQLYRLRELVVQLHFGLLNSNNIVKWVSGSATDNSHRNRCCDITTEIFCLCPVTCLRALRAIVWKACSTLIASLALVSKYGMLFLLWHQACARLVVTWNTKELMLCLKNSHTWEWFNQVIF